MTNTRNKYRAIRSERFTWRLKTFAHLAAIDKATMRHFDLACLTPVTEELPPEAIKQIRGKANMSQALFARVLNVTTQLVSKWERGEKKPSGPSLKLLAIADKKGIEAIL
jgi:putative transcriptional regulator